MTQPADVRKRPVSLFRQRNFALLWAGQSASVFGTEITFVAVPLTAVLVLHATPMEAGVLRALETDAFDLIIMDCHMPEVDGYEATRQIRQQEAIHAEKPIPVIALTASAMQEDQQRCTEAGMNDFMTKPLQARELDRMLQRWLG